MSENNKTNKFVSIIVSLITNVFFALGYCLKFVLPPLVILVKIIVAIFSLVFHLGSKSSSDDDYQNMKSGSSNFVGMDMGSGMRVDLGGIYDKKGHLIADKFDDE